MYSQLYYLQSKLGQYYNFSSQIQNLIDTLSPSINDLDETIKSIDIDFQFNDKSADNGDITKCRDKIDETINYLKNVIMAKISSNISSINNQIAQVEAEIEAEKQRRLEEAAKLLEEKSKNTDA